MKRPGNEDLITAAVSLELELERIAERRTAVEASPEYYTAPEQSLASLREREERLRRVCAWLDHLGTRPRPLPCTAGRNHRVRETVPRGDEIYVERCRCGAERVRDARRVGDEVTDWARPVLRSLPSDSEPSSGA